MAGQKIKPNTKQIITYAAAVILWLAAIILIWQSGPHHVGTGIDLTALLMLTVLVKLLGHLPFDFSSCLLLYPMLIIEFRCFYQYAYHMSFLTLLFLLDVCILLIWQTGRIRIKEYYMGLSVTALAAVVMLFAYDAVTGRLRPTYYALFGRSLTVIEKSALIVAFGMFFIILFILAIRLIGRITQRWRDSFRTISKMFYGLELYVFMLVVFTIFLMSMMEFASLFWHERFPYLPLFSFFFILTDIIYICLLVKTASIKEKMSVIEDDKNMIAAYNAGLETSLDSLREVRHDIKNLLLTMGGFVERSDDAQMKEFYNSNIVPFMRDALVKNELYDKLKILRDDSLKSFLLYKITEKSKCGICIKLEISSPVGIAIGYGDIVRLLGILIDNAAEEAEKINGSMTLKISEDEQAISIRIDNDVREQTKICGIRPGKSDKGPNRGNGLLIAQKIIAKYDNLILNSYFTDSKFIQRLIIMKQRRH